MQHDMIILYIWSSFFIQILPWARLLSLMLRLLSPVPEPPPVLSTISTHTGDTPLVAYFESTWHGELGALGIHLNRLFPVKIRGSLLKSGDPSVLHKQGRGSPNPS